MPSPQLRLPDLDEVAIGSDAVAGDAPPPAPPAPRHWLPRLTGLALTWLPLVVLALAAAFTWWLVKNSPQSPQSAPREVRHEPDYTLASFATDRFDGDGRFVAELAGDSLRHFPDTDTIEIDRVTLDARWPDQRPLTAQANLGLITAASQEVQLQGNAEVSSTSRDGTPVALRGERLTAWMDTHRVHTDAPVTVDWGRSRIAAAGLDYDPATELIRLAGPARARSVRPGQSLAP